MAEMVDFCRDQVASTAIGGVLETGEAGPRDAMNGPGRTPLRGWVETRDEGAGPIDHDGLGWFHVAVTPKKVMTTLEPVSFRRVHYRTGRGSTSLVPVDGREPAFLRGHRHRTCYHATREHDIASVPVSLKLRTGACNPTNQTQ